MYKMFMQLYQGKVYKGIYISFFINEITKLNIIHMVPEKNELTYLYILLSYRTVLIRCCLIYSCVC